MTLLESLLRKKKTGDRIPIWFMRQAGRYLPEYQELRSTYKTFLDFCADPKGAAEATLQPLRRFDLDAAIIFSDILVVPSALGQSVHFQMGEGPKLNALQSLEDLKCLSLKGVEERLSATSEAINIVKGSISQDKALIGFAGAPWTLACYMLEGGGSKSFETARTLMAKDPDLLAGLLDILVEATTHYLCQQARAGADVLKLFDSWAGHCPSWLVDQALVQPITKIIKGVRSAGIDVPIIYFPRGAGEKYSFFGCETGADGIAFDQFVDASALKMSWKTLPEANRFVLQGGLDPLVMLKGGDLLQQEVERYLEIFKGLPYIFNMGHGMVPHMPIEHVSKTIGYVRAWEKRSIQEEQGVA